jgi:tRNA threonylcarbamoyladenosine biosynthesis protein TsaB
MRRLLVAIELSQRTGTVAVGPLSSTSSADGPASSSVGPQPIEQAVPTATHERDMLFPTIDEILASIGAGPADVAAIAVSIGPGGFTGLRIATTAAKCMADALGVPIVAVPSALVAACGASVGASVGAGEEAGDGPWLVALASKGASAWITGVVGKGADVVVDGTPGLRTAEELRSISTSTSGVGFRTLLADEYAPAALVDHARSAGLRRAQPSFRARDCWSVGQAMLARGETIDPLRVAPLYPREPEAVSLWRERHGDAR